MLLLHSWALLGVGTLNSCSNFCIHITSAIALARALYSASVLDLESVACFLALQDIRFDPKNTAKPPIDLRSFGQPAQSTAAKVLTMVDPDLIIWRPRFKVPFIYWSILFTASLYRPRRVQKLAYLVQWVGQVRPRQGQVLKFSHDTSVFGRIPWTKGCTIINHQLSRWS
jgi:hypothetical protein